MGRVIVFGAGASMEYGGNHIPPPPRPLFCDNGFFPVVEELAREWSIRDGADYRPDHYDGSRWDWPTLRAHIEAACGMDPLPGLERAFSAVSERGRSAEDLFCRAIELALFWRIRGTEAAQYPAHVAFLKRALLPGATLITFNYDPLIEFALETIATADGVQWSPHDGYGVPIMRELRRDGEIIEVESRPSNVTLLKLHGSLNWLVGADVWPAAPEILLRLQTYGGPGFLCMREATTGRVLRPVFVPPMPDKDYKAFGLDALWRKAEDALRTADSLHVIGYSFPETDGSARKLMEIAAERLRGSKQVAMVTLGRSNWSWFGKLFPNATMFEGGFGAYVHQSSSGQ